MQNQELCITLCPETFNSYVMLQRIQSVFLALALVLLGLLFVLPYMRMVDAQGVEYAMSAMEYPMAVIQIITFAVTLITIFLYKKRMLQIRLCVFNSIALLGYQGVIIWYAYLLSKSADVARLNVTIVIPVIAAILIFLALRSIAKDEALVRSLDRLR